MILDPLTSRARAVRAIAATGMLAPVRPDKMLGIGRALVRLGPIAGMPSMAAIRHGDAIAVADEAGELTFADLDRRSNALANAWRVGGMGTGDGVAIMCRDHRFFVDATLAGVKLGARLVYLNTSFAAPQIADVVDREGIGTLVYDEEFAGLVAGAQGVRRVLAWQDSDADTGADTTLEALVRDGDPDYPPSPGEDARVVMLTSGTTGAPKGANRPTPRGIRTLGGMLERFPLKTGEATMVAAPMFHSWGFAHANLALSMGSKLVVRRRFDPERTIAAVAEHRATGLMIVPVMLARILDLGDDVLDRYDVSCLRVIGSGGSALPAELAERVLDRFGDVLYNLYGSTEVSVATIATPADMRAAPGTVGKPILATDVRLYDEHGYRVVGEGQVGRIFVGGELAFEGYTGGGGKEEIDGLLSSGDVGHFDAEGRLFVDGRDDDMIVSGAENVFPQEVEELLLRHDAIADAACIGVPDEEFGQRLAAFVVPAAGADPNPDEVRAYVREHLARYKVPREVTFIEQLPRNPTGKVLKRELRARAG